MSKQRDIHVEDKNIHLEAVIIVVSDSLSVFDANQWREHDKSAKEAENILKASNVKILDTLIVPDVITEIEATVRQVLGYNPHLVALIGGTGISPRDVTIEAIQPIFQKEMPGFGELFRYKTYQELGTISIMTRASAGVVNESLIVCLPGSKNAVSLGISLILEELLHVINLRRKKK
jgi:molybdenum cofactor biosynthesis protein B